MKIFNEIKLQKLNKENIRYFSLTDLLVILAVLSIISAITIPAFRAVREKMKTSICRDSILKITRANILYSSDFKHYAPAAIGNIFRWHGIRKDRTFSSNFDIEKGPLYPYFGADKHIRTCPVMAEMVDNSIPACEKGGWGYGYNKNIGSKRYFSKHDFWEPECEDSGVAVNEVKTPSQTIMFTDTATRVDSSGEIYLEGKIAEYAFCNSPEIINKGKPQWATPEPSIHFRHGGHAVCAWVDGHISLEKMSFSKENWGEDNIGFFGSLDNLFFSPLKNKQENRQ
jgi:prepilin-type processing-associated H-X9-DG protein